MSTCRSCHGNAPEGARQCDPCIAEGEPVPPLDNVEFVAEMMEWSKFGPVAQLFIMEAIGRYAKQVAALTPAELGNMPLIGPDAWIAVAKEIDAKMQARLK